MAVLTEQDRTRYARQMLLSGWGEAGQHKLKEASVLVAGAGGLGSPVSLYLAAAGVGELRIVDSDAVELSNLNRQILHDERRLGMPKAESAREALNALNSGVQVTPFAEQLDESNIERIAGGAGIVLDCLDNYETRYLLNTFCLRRGIPLVHGAIWGFVGQVTFLHPPETPCLRCIVPQPPAKATFPVLGATAGVTGCIQALEAVKFLVGIGTNLKGTLLYWDGEEMAFNTFQVKRNPSCPDCGR
jgi:molybdopterin-synthase adenylyltransferase